MSKYFEMDTYQCSFTRDYNDFFLLWNKFPWHRRTSKPEHNTKVQKQPILNLTKWFQLIGRHFERFINIITIERKRKSMSRGRIADV